MSKTHHARPAKAKRALPNPGAVRYDTCGKVTVLATGGGYIMARCYRCVPFVCTLAEWDLLSKEPIA